MNTIRSFFYIKNNIVIIIPYMLDDISYIEFVIHLLSCNTCLYDCNTIVHIHLHPLNFEEHNRTYDLLDVLHLKQSMYFLSAPQ